MEAPKVTVNVAVLDNDALLPALRKGELDIAFTHTNQFAQPDVTLELLRKDEFVVYCASTHRLARHRSITIDELAQERFAVATSAVGAFGSLLSLRQAFHQRGLPAPRIALASDLVMFKLRAVASSDLIGVALKGNVHPFATQFRLKILPVKGLDWIRPAAVAYRKDAYLSPAARRFIDILKATAREASRV